MPHCLSTQGFALLVPNFLVPEDSNSSLLDSPADPFVIHFTVTDFSLAGTFLKGSVFFHCENNLTKSLHICAFHLQKNVPCLELVLLFIFFFFTLLDEIPNCGGGVVQI